MPSEYSSIFKAVAEIYSIAKEVHGISGPVPVILAEDETKVKNRILWEPKYDTLTSFCGPKQSNMHFGVQTGGGSGRRQIQ